MLRFSLLRAALSQGRPVADGAFDSVYPIWAQEASPCFWTPVRVALEAALLLKQAGAQSVLDVGSGVGKFALVASLAGGFDVTGVEHRPYLVATARVAAERYRAPAKFICGRIEHIDPQSYDALYLFNPFGENLVTPAERLDHEVTLSEKRFASDVGLVENWLEEAPTGTSVVTYNGFGGRIPSSYELVSSRPTERHRVRLWTKRTTGSSPRATRTQVKSRRSCSVMSTTNWCTDASATRCPSNASSAAPKTPSGGE
jgi:predicted RNA methylase